MNLINKISLPIAVFGAIVVGLAGIGIDLAGELNIGTQIIQIAQLVIGAAGVVVAFGLITNK
ncbi:MAG: hypothetical protein LBQ49_02970 [Rickettsiales bacterium]|jgi:uncharacterized membrane protein YuzA (DUF378 family)|nr:hypothetical protein [Rickettsiales bacterium]